MTDTEGVAIEDLTITGGQWTRGGGAIVGANAQVEFRGIAVVDNDADSRGGGVYVSGGATANFTNSLIAYNDGGSLGGGLYYDAGSRGTLTGVTISNNRVDTFNSVGSGLRIFNAASVLVQNSTIASNTSSATTAAGIDAFSQTAATPLVLVNSIVYGNTNSNGAADIRGSAVDVASSMQNIIGESDGAFDGSANITGQDPQLLPLGFYGGRFDTHAIDIDSIARDNAQGVGETTDGRGVEFAARNDGFGVDIGAFEYQSIRLDVSDDGDIVDGLLGDGQLTLREALAQTNANPGSDNITFEGLIDVDRTRIDLINGQLEISDSTLLFGFGADRLIIDANDGSRVFEVSDDDKLAFVSISGLTIRGGHASTVGGGGILNDEFLVLQEVAVDFNSAATGLFGGGIYHRAGFLEIVGSTVAYNNAQFAGGGVFSASGVSQFTVTDSTISLNSADLGGGLAIDGIASIRNSTIAQNRAFDQGGGVFATGGPSSVDLNNSIVAENTISFTGPASDIDGPADAINASVSMHNLIGDAATSGGLVDGEMSNLVGADADLMSLRDNGRGVPTHALGESSAAINAGFENPVFNARRATIFARVADGAQDIGAHENQIVTVVVDDRIDREDGFFGVGGVSLREAIAIIANPGLDTINFSDDLNGSVITLNGTELVMEGGAIINGPGADRLTIDAGGQSRIFGLYQQNQGSIIRGLTLTDGQSFEGGAFWTQDSDVTLDALHFERNSASNGGGAIYTSNGGLTVRNSTFSDNEGDGYGGAVHLSGGDNVIENSTFYNNKTAGEGGAIVIGFAGQTTIRNSTFFANRANTDGVGDETGGAIATIQAGAANDSLTLVSNLFATNNADGILNDLFVANPDIIDLAASTHNLLESITGVGGLTDGTNNNLVGAFAGVLGFDFWGGPVPTVALQADSAAIDAGTSDFSRDGRASIFVRTFNGRTDIGAFERQTVIIDVDTNTDLVDGNLGQGELSIREALLLSQNPGLDEIRFDAALAGQTITLTAGSLFAFDDLRILGLGADQLIIDGAGQSSVFELFGGSFDRVGVE
ncbi:MAG: choice-of-anchor Q domain-containing protein, partial [Planctomycetota bacterium]